METFTFPCNFRSITEKINYRTIVSPFESGAEQTRAKWSAVLREWTLLFRKTAAIGNQLRDFYIARKGSAEAFYWTSPIDNVQYTVRFKDDVFTREAVDNSQVFICELTFIQTR